MKVQDFYNLLIEEGINCFCGVPDSLLKDFCAYITDNTETQNHTITANEGNAIGLAAGHFLASGKPALVYMQNSGLGNCINPLLSLTDEEVYNIPLLMLIGWRGEPGRKDEPQHIKQGKVTESLLEAANIDYAILPENFEKAEPLIKNAFVYMKETRKPYAFIIRKGTFEKYSLKNKNENGYSLEREDAIETVIKQLSDSDIIVSTTGYISREVYETRERLGQSHKQDFLTVGSMGHASSVALGIALEKPERNIYCLDGDGAFLMHQGAIVINASKNLNNYKHIVFNNEAHDSVGAQPTAASTAQLAQLAKFAGYKNCYSVSSKDDLIKILPDFIKDRGTSFLEIKVKCGAREDLGRPKETPCENKQIFTENLRQISYCCRGAIEKLPEILQGENVKKVLVFTGKKSFESIKPVFETKLEGKQIIYYNDFSTNPKKDEVDLAITKIPPDFDIIIAAGGGSVIDFAKAYRYYTKSGVKLIAIPTTCGTGSEATQFAVIYTNGIKHSLDTKNILPEYAIIDSQFTENVPKEIKTATALDALCQAIESCWAVNSTPESREYARKALVLCKQYLVDYINTPDKINSEKMCLASNYAGKAINISRTTAAHAISYPITTYYGMPHGKAVAMSIMQLCELNSETDSTNCNDSRGEEFVREKVNEIKSILEINKFHEYFTELFNKIGFEYPKNLDTNKIIGQINLQRLNNNPRKLTHTDIIRIISKI